MHLSPSRQWRFFCVMLKFFFFFFWICTRKNITIKKNIWLEYSIPANYMKWMWKLKEKYIMFKSQTDINIVKLDTFESATAHVKNKSVTKSVLYSWYNSNGKIWFWQNTKNSYDLTIICIYKKGDFIYTHTEVFLYPSWKCNFYYYFPFISQYL